MNYCDVKFWFGNGITSAENVKCEANKKQTQNINNNYENR